MLGLLILLLASVPIAVVWLNSESILVLLRQVPCVARSVVGTIDRHRNRDGGHEYGNHGNDCSEHDQTSQ